MFNYDKDINACDIEIQSMITCVVLTQGDEYKEVYPSVLSAELWAHSILYNNHNSELAKTIKKNWLADISSYILSGLNSVKDKHMKMILGSSIAYERKLNIAMSVARWPEFYLHSETKLKEIGSNLKAHLKDINAINFYDANNNRICPYNPDGYFNDLEWEETLIRQESWIKEYMSMNDIRSQISADWIIGEVKELYKEIVSDKPLSSFCYLEQGFVESIRNIRNYSRIICENIKKYKDGNATVDQYGLSESKSPISDFEPVMQTLNSLGYTKRTCPMVLANLFHGNFPSLEIKPQKGQIHISSYNAEGFTVAPGLGPAYKIRYVFNADANIQNIISEYANIIQESDRSIDRMEAYNDQMTRLLEDLPYISDAFCTDSTGYSDYLSRTIYTILMLFHGIDPETIDFIQKIFRMPLLIEGKEYEVRFGSMQGCKLLVFIMNQANRLMGILANRHNRQRVDCRCNAGDDVEAHLINGIFSEEAIMDELAIFAYFNCPTNLTKSAWLERDGYFDYCSKYYARTKGNQQGVFSITGLPPKIAGKQIISINGFAELFKVLDTAKTQHRSCKESWEILAPILRKTMEEGSKLPTVATVPLTLDQKIEYAKQYPYEIGGLADDIEISTERKLSLLKYKTTEILKRYIFDPSGIFLLMQQLGEDFRSTELYKALGTITRQSMKDIAKVILILNTSIDCLSSDDIEWAVGKINRFERNIIKGESISRNISTYHRKTPKKDIDIFIPVQEILNYKDLETIPMAEDLMEASILLCSITDEKFVDVDNIRNYIYLRYLYKRHSEKLVKYNHGPSAPYYAIDEGDGLRVRLTSDPWSYYGYGEQFKWPEDIIDPEVRELYNLLIRTGSIDLYCQLEDSINDTLQEAVTDYLQEALIEMQRDELSCALRLLFPGSKGF